MSYPSGLDDEIQFLLSNIHHLKAQRNVYLNALKKDILDLYLFSVMEEEDPLYNLLHRCADYVSDDSYHDLKILSPFNLQINIMISLPFLPSHLEVEDGGFGFVKLKLPENIENSMACSKVWREACQSRIQKSLLRHITSWKDENGYLQQKEVLKWFIKVVERSLAVTGEIPNYNIELMNVKDRVVLQLEDIRNDLKFSVNLLPVICFPTALLPPSLSSTVPQDPTCDMWMLECRSNASSDLLWSPSLWLHERKEICTIGKTMIHVLKSLRDGRKWSLLTNYHIRTLVIHEYRKNPERFQNSSQSSLLLYLLHELRNRLVSREGLPSIWEDNHNLFCGLNGHEKSGLARSVTRTKNSLECSSEDPKSLFRLELYSPVEDLTRMSESNGTYNEAVPNPPSTTSMRATEEVGLHDQAPTQGSGTNHTSFPRRAEFRTEGSSGNQQDLMQGTNNWWQAGIVAAGVAAAILGGVALARRNNK